MVRNGYGTKMIFTMVRNGRYEMVMVRNDCNSSMTSKCSFPSPDFLRPHRSPCLKLRHVDCLAFKKLQITQVL
jgi:hypothetical protein